MPDWLEDFTRPQAELLPGQLALRLLTAFGLGLLVAFVHRRTSAPGGAVSFHVTLVLLTILIAAVTQVIGDSVARAFSLVGALSIVRFRTVVQDTRDTVFVIFAVTVGMAVGTGHVWVALISFAVVALAALLTKPRKPALQVSAQGGVWQLSLRVTPGQGVEARAAEVLATHARHTRLVKVATVRGGAALESEYQVELRESAAALGLIDALNQLAGVQACELSAAPQD
jgi:hypothetical protein